MACIQFGWVIPRSPTLSGLSQPFLENIRQCIELISASFSSVWSSDHIQIGELGKLEAWTAITYLSALYPHLTFGHNVLCQSFRNPALLAKMVATLEFLSNNRLIFGIGAGWKEDEYLAYGYEFPPPSIRVAELEEALHIVKSLWTEKRTTFIGKHYSVVNAACEPKPEPLPTVMIGGSKPHMLRLIARHADWWAVAASDIETYRQQVEECTRACQAVGRDPATLRRVWSGGCVCAPTEEQVQALYRDRTDPNYVFVGTPNQIIEKMSPFVAMGVEYFLFTNGGFPDTTTLEMLAQRVLPVLNDQL